MCGICGIYSSAGNADLDRVKKMNSLLYHRGPDDDGYYLSDNRKVAFAMRRLAIQDVSSGSQPVFNEDKSIAAVFNGEIYNFRTLRSDLEKKGHTFRSNSDSELIPHLFEEYGTQFVDHCNGMFAIAVYTNDTIYLFRDRLGIKPLYFSEHENMLIFSSEIKSIVSVFPELKDIDMHALNSYLNFSYIPEPSSIYCSIKKLLPGHFIKYDENSFDIQKYWFPESHFNTLTSVSEQEASEKFEQLLYDSVKIRMISDVELGAFLSGGLDSSAIVSLMNRVSHGVKTFSIGFSGNDHYDESSYAKLVAQCLNTDHYEYMVDEGYAGILENIVKVLDEPFADSSCIPMYMLAEKTREHVTVTLSGTGSDELLGGYRRYLLDRVTKPFSYIPGLSKVLSKVLSKANVSRETSFQQYMLYMKKMCDLAEYEDTYKYYATQSVFLPDMIEELFRKKEYVSDQFNVFRRYMNEQNPNKLSFLQFSQFMDVKIYLPADLLVKEDRMTMAHSLESRVPFLDHRIVEFCLGLPDDLKVRNFNGKYLLKKIMNLEIPQQIIERPKHGFAVPIEKWFRSELLDQLFDLMNSADSITKNYFNRKKIEELGKQHNTKKYDRSAQLWSILMLELWNKEHNI